MDTEQQIRLNFLEEAEEHFDQMETNLVGLAQTEIDSQTIDIVLRAAHSIKGGAGMMGFTILSKVAHRLEDFLKILRVRYVASKIETEVETLLLRSVDYLRDIRELHLQGFEFTESDIDIRTKPIFDRLQEYLGNLEAADEDALMSQDEDVDPALLLFEEGVEDVLERFASQLAELGISELAQELAATAQELMAFGNMANLEPFIQLCQSVEQQVTVISQSEITSLANKALKTWRRSHALVLRGKLEKLPSSLEDSQDTITKTKPQLLEQDFPDLSEIQSAFEEAESELDFDPLEDSRINLSEIQSAFEEAESELDFDPLEDSKINLSEIQSAFEETELQFETDTVQELATQQSPLPALSVKPSVEKAEKLVRVPASQLKQFNNLFEQLILNRNSINLKVQQFQNVIALVSQRIAQMERSNTELRQWYDRASLEGFLSNQEQTQANLVTSFNQQHSEPIQKLRGSFDALEMDRYTDIHLICQEQIETIVQLQEVATDIELGLQEINQAVRDLNYTTKSMQGNVTRTQMLPFADAVKRFPRVIRDLSLQFNKQVNLKIMGENTLLDRSVIEALSDPLMHLLRNAFDHGIEDTETRIKRGKDPSGTITIQASNQGTYTVITIKDDGGGISLKKIRDRLMQMGISSEDVAQISEAELLDFIFEPGFSTAKKVTELSGRGVGMDVVRTNLQEIRGDIKVTTELEQSTTFTLRIPFTLSILRVAVIEQNGIIFAIPANLIRELVPSTSDHPNNTNNTKWFNWNNTAIPLIEADNLLFYRRTHKGINLPGNPAIDQPMTLVVGDGVMSTALSISRFWQEQESTIRSIDSLIPLTPGVISSVVFGDGKVIPLIDPLLLLEASFKANATQEQSAESITEINERSLLPTQVQTILIVDDSINVRRYLSLTLEKAGYLVEQAKDGLEAVEKIFNGLTVQAVISDVEMPKLDGYGVLEEIRDRAEFAQLPIIMLTSRSNEKHRKLAMNLGASAYFSKPYNEQQLLQTLTELILNSKLS